MRIVAPNGFRGYAIWHDVSAEILELEISKLIVCSEPFHRWCARECNIAYYDESSSFVLGSTRHR